MLPCKKIFIDTKHKTTDSTSNSNFRWELPETLSLPHNIIFYVDDVCIPHSWYTIETNINDKLYLMVCPTDVDADGDGIAYKIVTIDPGIYNGGEIAIELQTKMEASINNVFFLTCYL